MRWLVMVAALCAGGAAQAEGVVGSYAVSGTGLDGSLYDGTAEIVAVSEVTCEITWITGGQTSVGICMRHDNAFAASYVIGDRVGMAIYEIMDDGTMVGTWTIQGADTVGTETLAPN